MRHHRPSAGWGPTSVVIAAFAFASVGCGHDHRTADNNALGEAFVCTSAEDFESGASVNVDTDRVPGAVTLKQETSTFPFIWIALSARGTICKIDTRTGEIKGEYRTAPEAPSSDFSYPNPSRTTVGLDGSAWAGNRQARSVIHVGLVEANQAVDRNGNGVIDTSTGYGDVRPWPNASDVDTDGGVETAEDECILHFVRTVAPAVRHVSIAPDGDVWVSGIYGGDGDHVFQKLDHVTGAVLRTEGPFAGGGYGGLVDGNGVIWSASSGSPGVLRWDPSLPIDGANPKVIDIPNYGMAIDPSGFIWVGTLDGSATVRKLAPDGTVVGTFAQGTEYAQGLACGGNGDVWISSSLYGFDSVAHLRNDGTLVGIVHGVGLGSTGVAVDAAGKIWTANIQDSNASRIDPAGGDLAADGVTRIGAVDLTVPLPGASPYNYSDMTGAVALNTTSPQGAWQMVIDGVEAGRPWIDVHWNEEPEGVIPAGASVIVEVRVAETQVGLGAQLFVPVENGQPVALEGRFLEVRVTLKPAGDGAAPVLSDLTAWAE